MVKKMEKGGFYSPLFPRLAYNDIIFLAGFPLLILYHGKGGKTMDIEQEYREKVKLCYNHIEAQSKNLQDLINKMDKNAGLFSEYDFALSGETAGTELERTAADLQTISRQYKSYLKAAKKKNDKADEMEKTLSERGPKI